MLTTPLASRDDLVESLDSESIFDYLIQHGVLDEGQREGIEREGTRAKRNTVLLEHVEGEGGSAVALFINALRQSGQLALASSLDETSRIKPTYGTGYLGKERHKGQVTVQVKVGSILALFPVWEDGDDEESDDEDKQGHSDSLLNVVFTPRRAHKSYENMTMIGEPGSARSWKIQEYNYDSDEESRGSCWCFCRPKRKKEKVIQDKASKRRLDYEVKQNPASKMAISNGENCKQYVNGTSKNSHSRSVPQRELSTLKHDSKNNVMSPRSGRCDTRVLYSKGEISEAKLNSELREIYRNSLSSLNNRIGSCDSVNLKQNVQSVRSSTISLEGKENLPPDQSGKNLRNSSATKEQKLKKNHSLLRDSLKSYTKEPVEHCVMWKRRGPTFDSYAEKFYNNLDNAVNMDIIKYFEQERGSLVLSVSVEDCLVICTICMTRQQIQHVTEDIENGELLKIFESLLLSQEIKDTMCVSDLKLKVVVQQEEVTLAFQELS